MTIVKHEKLGMSLSEERCRFTEDVAALLYFARTFREGHAVALDQVKRTLDEAKANAAKGTGIIKSLHVSGLAVDLLLYVDGAYQTDTDAYRHLGDWWKARRAENRWGGDFHNAKGEPKPDGNHFERRPEP
jgi:hypothetical protein